jgi:Zn-dependent peptidase ImmA (M78 family)
MPWNGRTALEQRRKFVEERQLDQDDFAELCRKYGVSRQALARLGLDLAEPIGGL